MTSGYLQTFEREGLMLASDDFLYCSSVSTAITLPLQVCNIWGGGMKKFIHEEVQVARRLATGSSQPDVREAL
jgi:hypothetical protein